MRNAKLILLTVVTAFSALGCSIRMNSHPEYAAPPPAAETVETYSYGNNWDTTTNLAVNQPARPSSVAGAAEAVKSPKPAASPAAKPPVTRNMVEKTFSLH
jgi:hypothetical protein